MASYSAIDQLTQDVLFGGRIRACATQQAETFANDQRPQIIAAAEEVMRGGPNMTNALTRMTAAGPNGAPADNGDGTIDQTKVEDPAILSAVQAYWPTAAALFFDDEGKPINV